MSWVGRFRSFVDAAPPLAELCARQGRRTMHYPYQCSSVKNPAICWEQVPCPLCGAQDETPFLSAPAEPNEAVYHLVQCRSCDMVYMNPRPDEQSIAQFYPDDYEAYCQAVPEQNGPVRQIKSYLQGLVRRRRLGYAPPLRRPMEKALAWLVSPWCGPDPNSQTSLPYFGQGRLLDYGCGAGAFAVRMRQRGWTVTGMDFSALAASQARRLHGLDVITGTLPHPAVRPESFDLISMGAVLEHVHWPHRLIDAAVTALRPGGILAVSVPNICSWGFRFFGEDWWPLELPRHLLHFSPATLARLMASHGLEIVEMRRQKRGSWMRRSIDRSFRPGRPFAGNCFCNLFRSRLVDKLLTSWSGWVGHPDSLLVLARRPAQRHMRGAVEAA